MKNAAVARVFQDMADLLELKEESYFKIRAYQRAAHAIESLPVELAQVLEEGRLREIPGVGEAIAKKIAELLKSGRLQAYESLRQEFPEGITALMDIPGIGPKTAMRLYKELGVTDAEGLERAIVEGQVAALYRLGDRTAENILRHVRKMRRKDRRIPLGQALPVVEEIMGALAGHPGLRNLTPAGSLRRFKETVGDVDLMGTADDPEGVIGEFIRLPAVEEVLGSGSTKGSVIVDEGLQVDLRMVPHDSFGSLLQHFTGSKEHNVVMRERAVHRGLSLSEYGITVTATGELEKFDTEEAFYERLGLQFIPPELREGRNEVELAGRMALPKLVEPADIKGDLHVHTEWSDGHDSVRSMLSEAIARGYRYLAITDHSVGRGIAHGLGGDRLAEQIAEIRAVSQELGGLRVFTGAEVDIRADGSLDLPDEALAELDVVIAAVHSAMGQDSARMTERIIRALENPHVNILAHPTCRLIGVRDPVEVDMDEVLRVAARTGTALEINAMPDRLDLKDVHAMRARELGAKLVIGTDAHSARNLDLMRFGVRVARRGWCEPKDIVNTWDTGDVESFLRARRVRK